VTTFDLSPEAARSALSLFEEPPGDDAAAAERYATVVWSHLTEPGDSVAHRVVTARGAAAALRAVVEDVPLPELTGRERADARKRWLPRLAVRDVADALRVAHVRGVSLVTVHDATWPSHLDDLDVHAPLCLWVRGDVTALTRLRPSVALVGARAASSYGDHVAMELAADLAGGGIPIVSGGAYGIDGAAHRAALAVGGLTVALLAGGAERAYPAGHTRLIDDVAETGVVLSEVPCGSAPTKWRFLQRNRLIAALSDATVVVEAGWRSGSLNTAGHAAALSRQLGAVPGPITSATSAGTHRLLREFGAACITSAQDVREMLGMTGGSCAPPEVSTTSRGTGTDPRTDDTTRVRDALSTRTWRDASDIARRAGMTPADTEGVLGLLHLEGSAQRASAGWRLTSNAR
jgi:DNA processing protein